MKAYIFSILAAEEELFLREIALSEENTLLDFHNILTKNLKVDNDQLASFYLTNHEWEKEKEFTLMDMDFDDYTNEKAVESIPIDTMENAIIGEIITDPEQHILYEYNFVNPTIFLITLADKREAKKSEKFPKVLLSEGNINIEIDSFFDDSFDAEMQTRGRSYESYNDLMDDGFEEDDLRVLGFENEDGLFNDEFYGSDSYRNDDF